MRVIKYTFLIYKNSEQIFLDMAYFEPLLPHLLISKNDRLKAPYWACAIENVLKSTGVRLTMDALHIKEKKELKTLVLV